MSWHPCYVMCLPHPAMLLTGAAGDGDAVRRLTQSAMDYRAMHCGLAVDGGPAVQRGGDGARQDGFGGTFDGLGADAAGLGRAGDSAQLRGRRDVLTAAPGESPRLTPGRAVEGCVARPRRCHRALSRLS